MEPVAALQQQAAGLAGLAKEWKGLLQPTGPMGLGNYPATPLVDYTYRPYQTATYCSANSIG